MTVCHIISNMQKLRNTQPILYLHLTLISVFHSMSIEIEMFVVIVRLVLFCSENMFICIFIDFLFQHFSFQIKNNYLGKLLLTELCPLGMKLIKKWKLIYRHQIHFLCVVFGIFWPFSFPKHPFKKENRVKYTITEIHTCISSIHLVNVLYNVHCIHKIQYL